MGKRRGLPLLWRLAIISRCPVHRGSQEPHGPLTTDQLARMPEELTFPFTLNIDTRFTYMQTIRFHPPCFPQLSWLLNCFLASSLTACLASLKRTAVTTKLLNPLSKDKRRTEKYKIVSLPFVVCVFLLCEWFVFLNIMLVRFVYIGMCTWSSFIFPALGIWMNVPRFVDSSLHRQLRYFKFEAATSDTLLVLKGVLCTHFSRLSSY